MQEKRIRRCATCKTIRLYAWPQGKKNKEVNLLHLDFDQVL